MRISGIQKEQLNQKDEILSPTDSDEESEFILCEAETDAHNQIDGAKNSAFYENPKPGLCMKKVGLWKHPQEGTGILER